MNAQPRIHNQTTDGIRAAYMAKLANRPQIDPHDLKCAQQIGENVIGWLRNLYVTLQGRPDLQQYVRSAGASLNVLADRLREEQQQGRAH